MSGATCPTVPVSLLRMTPSNLAKWAAKLAAVLIVWLAARLGLHIADADATVLAAGLIAVGAGAVPSLQALIHRGPLSDYILGHKAGAKAGRAAGSKAAFDQAAALVTSLRNSYAHAANAPGASPNPTPPDPLTEWTLLQMENTIDYLRARSK